MAYFTVKATYKSETRKFVFTHSSEFPSYRALQDQLLRVFPISHRVYLSKLLFSPSGDNNARLLIGVEVHTEDEYETHVKPYRGKQWPGALLRFSVFDDAPHKVPSVLSLSTEETNTVCADSEDAQPLVDVTVGPDVPEGRRALRSLLDSRSSTAYSGRLHWPDLERTSGARELPHPPAFHPAKHPYYGLGNSRDVPPSPWRWLPPPPPIPGPFTRRAQDATVPPPPPPPHSLRPVSSMPVLRDSDLHAAQERLHAAEARYQAAKFEDSVLRKSLKLPEVNLPNWADRLRDAEKGANELPPPPPPPRPRPMESSASIPPAVPPPVPARPDELPEHSRLTQKHLLQRLARRSRPEPDVEQHPMNANRHSWAGDVPSKAQSLDDYMRESKERGAAETSALARLFTAVLDKRESLELFPPQPTVATASELRESRRAALLAAQQQLREKQAQQARTKRKEFEWNPWLLDDVKTGDDKENVAEQAAAVPVPVIAPSTSTSKISRKGTAIVIDGDSSDDVEIPVRIDKGKRAAHRVKFSIDLEDKSKGKAPVNPISKPVRTAAPSNSALPPPPPPLWTQVPSLPVFSMAKTPEEYIPRRRHMPRKPVPSVANSKTEPTSKANEAASQLSTMQSQFEHFRENMNEFIETARQQETELAAKACEVPAPAPQPVTPEAPQVVHMNIRCDMCDKTIEGVRHKCLNCPDFDLCTSCLTAARVNKQETLKAGEARLYGGHQPSHIFFPIEEAGDLWLHTAFKDAETELPGPVEQTGIADAATPEGSVTHNATCDLCDSSIVGSRFKCLNCPDWDVCASCFTIVPEQHPGHGFVEVKDPGALKQFRNVLAMGSRSRMHHASCDACKETIRGVRYKCMHPSCADYDLCERCEALPHPVHPPTHAFLKLRSPELPISLFRPTPAPVYQVPPAPSAPAAPVPRMPSPPSFLPVVQTTSSESAEDLLPSILTLRPAPTMPGGLPMSPVIPPSRSPPVIEAIVNQEPLVINVSESASPYATPARTPVFPEVPTEAPRAPSPDEVDRMLAYAQDAIAQADEVNLPVQEQASVEETSEEKQQPKDAEKDATTGTTTGTGTPSVQSRMSLPHVQPTDLTELFDLAAQFRHIWAQTHSGGMRTPPVVMSPVQAQQQEQEPVVVEVQETKAPEPVNEVQPQVEMMQREPEAVSFPRTPVSSVPSSVSVPTYSVNSPSEPIVPAEPSPLSTHSLLASPPPPAVPRTVRSFVQPSRYGQLHNFSPIPASEDTLPYLTEASVSAASRPLSFVTDDASTAVGAPAALRAAFVADNNIPDGQVFPPGAEFVKSWAMVNDGPAPWPASTELTFVAGDRLGLKSDRFKVGRVMPGEEVDVWTGEMKAPENPGKYISYWRLSDGQGNRFGHSIWVDVNVAESVGSGTSESSMTASSIIIMPQPASTGSASVPAAQDEATTVGTSAAHEDDGSSQSSVSFLDVPSDEEDIFEDSRSRTGASPAAPGLRSPADDFVVLYDSSDDEEML